MASEPQALNTDDAFPLQREYTLRPNEVLRRVPGAQRQHLLRWRDQGRITAKDSSIGKKKVSLYAESEIPTMRRLAGAIKGRFPATHEEFKTCDANRRAFEAVCRIARGRNSAANPVCIFGDAGVGKTHLLMAVEPFCWEWDPSRAVRYVSCRNASVPASGSFVSPAAAKVLSNCDILLIDDWDELTAQPSLKWHVETLIESRVRRHLHTIVACRHAPKAEWVGNRLASLFRGGFTVEVGAPDFETRCRIIQRRVEQEREAAKEWNPGHAGPWLTDEVVRFVAEKISCNIRELGGFVNRLCSLPPPVLLPQALAEWHYWDHAESSGDHSESRAFSSSAATAS